MNTTEYLGLFLTMKNYAEADAEEIAMLGEKIYGIMTPAYGEKVKCSTSKDSMGNAVVKKVLSEEHYREEIEDYMSKMGIIRSQIKKMAEIDNKYYQVLQKKYVLGMSLSSIARSTGYSLSQTRRIWEDGLILFDERYGTKYRLKKREDFIRI